jgi:hypothetical protein
MEIIRDGGGYPWYWQCPTDGDTCDAPVMEIEEAAAIAKLQQRLAELEKLAELVADYGDVMIRYFDDDTPIESGEFLPAARVIALKMNAACRRFAEQRKETP